MSGSLVIHNQYIKDFSFENPKAPESFGMEQAPAFNLSLDVRANRFDTHLFEVILAVDIKATHNEETVFVISLEYAGMFTIELDDQEQLQRALMVNCAQLLFPYARFIISRATQDGGYLPLNLQPVDFLGLYEKKISSEPSPEAQPSN